MRFLNCWETAISDNSNSIIVNNKTLSLFSIAKCLFARLYPGRSNVNDGNSLIPYIVGFISTNSFKTNTITGYLSYRKELLDKALAMIVVPLFNDDDESLELFIQTNEQRIKYTRYHQH